MLEEFSNKLHLRKTIAFSNFPRLFSALEAEDSESAGRGKGYSENLICLNGS